MESPEAVYQSLKRVRQQGWNALMDDWHRRRGAAHHTHCGPVLVVALDNNGFPHRVLEREPIEQRHTLLGEADRG